MGDLLPNNAEKLLSQPVDLDKSGNGQFYCVHCAKYLIDRRAFQDHVKGKPHKRRLHALETEPYTIEESERAAGMGSFVAPKKRKMETMIPKIMEGAQDITEVVKDESKENKHSLSLGEPESKRSRNE